MELSLKECGTYRKMAIGGTWVSVISENRGNEEILRKVFPNWEREEVYLQKLCMCGVRGQKTICHFSKTKNRLAEITTHHNLWLMRCLKSGERLPAVRPYPVWVPCLAMEDDHQSRPHDP